MDKINDEETTGGMFITLSIAHKDNFGYAYDISKSGYIVREGFNIPKNTPSKLSYIVTEIIQQGHIVTILKKAKISITQEEMYQLSGNIIDRLPKNTMKVTAACPIYIGVYKIPNTEFILELDLR